MNVLFFIYEHQVAHDVVRDEEAFLGQAEPAIFEEQTTAFEVALREAEQCRCFLFAEEVVHFFQAEPPARAQ